MPHDCRFDDPSRQLRQCVPHALPPFRVFALSNFRDSSPHRFPAKSRHLPQNDRDQRAAGVAIDLTKNLTTATPLHPMVLAFLRSGIRAQAQRGGARARGLTARAQLISAGVGLHHHELPTPAFAGRQGLPGCDPGHPLRRVGGRTSEITDTGLLGHHFFRELPQFRVLGAGLILEEIPSASSYVSGATAARIPG